MRISIPEPCHEKWSEMTPNEKGAFCSVCAKTVVDFTSMTDDEVKDYFLQKTGQRTCGRFRQEQLYVENTELKNILTLQIPLWKKIVAAIFILFGSLLTSCEPPTIGKIAVPKETQNKSDTIKEAESVLIQDTLVQLPTETIEKFTTVGILSIELPPIVGDVMLEPIPEKEELSPVTGNINKIDEKEQCNKDTVTINH